MSLELSIGTPHTSTTARAVAAAHVDFNAIKQRQQATWASGDYAIIGTTLQTVGESLAEAVDVRAGEAVLDVAAGNGNATLAAYFPGAWVSGNWLQGGPASKYPIGNVFSGTFPDAFTNLTVADYRASAGSPLLTGSTDTSAIGADTGVLLSALPHIIEGSAIATTTTTAPRAPTALRITG